MKFAKIHSLGNDFLIVEEEKLRGIEDKPALARQICERHTGVGADGLLLIRIKEKAGLWQKGFMIMRKLCLAKAPFNCMKKV